MPFVQQPWFIRVIRNYSAALAVESILVSGDGDFRLGPKVLGDHSVCYMFKDRPSNTLDGFLNED